MAVSIKTNMVALRISRQIGRTSDAVSTSFQRLSSGSRLNKASDDPGGLSVATNLRTAQIVKTRAGLNVSDGISAAQIASGTLETAAQILSRMAELAGEGANGSYSSAQRAALDKEFTQLGLELQRTANATTFNGNTLLLGQKSARAATQITTNAINEFDTTGDGRYVTYHNTTNSRLEQLDTTTGSVTTIASLTNASSITTTNSGDVAFVSTSNVNGLSSSGFSQLYYYNKDTGTISKITSSSAGEGIIATASADGSKIAFASKKLYTSSGGSAGTTSDYAIHTYDTSTGIFTRSADSDYAVLKLALSSDGSYLGISGTRTHGIALEDADYLTVIKSADLTTSSAARELGTISNAMGSNFYQSFDVLNDGRILYVSELDQGGLSVNSARQVYEYSYETTGYRKLTNLSAGQEIIQLRVKDDGSSLTFIGNTNFLGENSGLKFQAFRVGLTSGSTTQLTQFTGIELITSGTISKDGNTLYYAGTGSKLTTVDISAANFDLSIDTGNGTTGAVLTALGALDGTLKGLGTHGLTSQKSSRAALDFARLNITRLGTLQGSIGASMSRLQTAGRLLSVEQSMFAAAYSRIADADIAEETSKSVRNKILQDTNSGLLAQANVIPKLALTLLETL